MINFTYSQAPPSIKVVVTSFLLLVGIGYVFGLINIYNNMGMSYTGVVVHYRGDTEEVVPPEFAFTKLIHEHHVHIFSIAKLFFLVGMLFCFTSLPEKIKVICVAAPFIGMFLDFASLWLLSLTSAFFGWTTMVFGGFMALSFFLIIGRPLYEMWVLAILEKQFGPNLPSFFK